MDVDLWENQIIPRLLESFWFRKGIHCDESENYTAFLEQLKALCVEKLVCRHVDSHDRLHEVRVERVFYVRPYEHGHGMDNPIRATLRGNYAASVYGYVVHRILAKARVPLSSSSSQSVDNDEDDDDDDDDGESSAPEEEEEEEETAGVEQDTNNNNGGDDDDDDDSDDDAADDDDDNDDDKSDDVEEEEEEEEAEDDPLHQAGGMLSRTLHGLDIMARHPSKSSGKCDTRYEFAFDEDTYEEYSVELELRRKGNPQHLFDIPAGVSSVLCNASSPWMDPLGHTHPFVSVGGMYVVNRHLQTCLSELSQRQRDFFVKSPEEIEVRSNFIDVSRVGRTNSTLQFTYTQKAIRKPSKWAAPRRVLMVVPREKPVRHIPVGALALAYGADMDAFAACIRGMVLGTKAAPPRAAPEVARRYPRVYDTKEITEYVDSECRRIRADVLNCATQSDALKALTPFYNKCGEFKDMKDRVSYLCYNLHGEILPHLNIVDSRGVATYDYAVENRRKVYLLASICAEFIRMSDGVQKRVPVLHRYMPRDRNSHELLKLVTPGSMLVTLARKFMRDICSKGIDHMRQNPNRIDLDVVFDSSVARIMKCFGNGTFDNRRAPSESSKNKTRMLVADNTRAIHREVSGVNRNAFRRNTHFERLLPHPTQSGRIDFVTPENKNCGNVICKSAGGFVSAPMDDRRLDRLIGRLMQSHAQELGLSAVPRDAMCPPVPTTKYDVFDVFGGLCARLDDPLRAHQLFREWRQSGIVPYTVGFELNITHRYIRFHSEDGRVLRPLLVVSALPRLESMMRSGLLSTLANPVAYLLSEGFVEYLDACEEYSPMISVCDGIPELNEVVDAGVFTHMEIHGANYLNPCTMAPFTNHSAGPRIMYTANMQKNAFSMKARASEGESISHTMYAQRKLIPDPFDALHPTEPEAVGVLATVALYCDTSNMEDATVVNRRFLEYGALSSSSTSVFTVAVSSAEVFRRPDEKTHAADQIGAYKYLDANGLPIVGSIVPPNHAIVGKVQRRGVTRNAMATAATTTTSSVSGAASSGLKGSLTCTSKFTPSNVTGYVERVMVYPDAGNMDTARVVRVHFRHLHHAGEHHPQYLSREQRGDNRDKRATRISDWAQHVPNDGDKIFMPYGQKSTIVTRAPEDMPFCEDGTIPDILLNAGCVTRTTPGLLLDMLMSTVCALRPDVVRKHANNMFIPHESVEERIRSCERILVQHGYAPDGTRVMCDGTTGKRIKCRIFSGLVPVQLLKHMSQPKLRHRGVFGPLKELERQPPAGQRNAGGLRVSELMSMNLTGYGVDAVARNLNYTNSDAFQRFWCMACKMYAVGNDALAVYMCHGCGRKEDIVRVSVPYVGGALVPAELRGASWDLRPDVVRDEE